MRELFLNPANHILSIITFLPLLGAIIIMLVPKRSTLAVKLIANIVVLLDFILSVPLFFYFQQDTWKFQFIEKVPWIDAIGVNYMVGMDGVSLAPLPAHDPPGSRGHPVLVARHHRKGQGILFLYAVSADRHAGACSLPWDFFLFYVFWEIMLVPMYFLIGVWGGPDKLYAAIKFFLYTLLGSLLMLLGILTLFFYHFDPGVHSACTHSPGTYELMREAGTLNIVEHWAPGVQLATPNLAEHGVRTFNILAFTNMGLPYGFQWWIFLAFFVGFAIKVPMFPFHTWLPDAHVEAPTAGSVILAGVLLKMGTYGFIRFSLPMLPEATKEFVPFMVVLSIIGIIYGALVAMMQPDMKKLIAYSSVSHLGFCMLGIFALNPIGLQGGMLQMINHGLATGALFMIVGIVYERRHTRMIADFGGLSNVMPVYATIFLIITLSSIGMPGLNGFIGEFLILNGVFNVNWVWAAYATVGIILGAAYMLWLYQRTMFGKITHEENKLLKDLNFREFMTFAPLIFFCVWIGLYPKTFLKPMEATINHIVTQVDPTYFDKPQLQPVVHGGAHHEEAAHGDEDKAPHHDEEPGSDHAGSDSKHGEH